jgi:5'-nucleotidase
MQTPKKKKARSTSTARVTKDKPVILITNDDGIGAPGIRNLVDSVKDMGHIYVVAPDKPQSGMGHAITIGEPLRLHKTHHFDGITSYACSGTPLTKYCTANPISA